MIQIFVVHAFLLAPLHVVSARPVEPPDVQEVASRYHRAMFEERNLDDAFALTAADVAFIDPTAEVWGGPAAIGVRGKPKLRKLVESWAIESSSLDVQQRIVSGEHAVLAGSIAWKAVGRPAVEGVPFCTILRVRDGAIVERRDYGAYDRLIPQAQSTGPELERAARAYFDAWRALDAEDLAELVAPDFVFVDPTAAPPGEAAPVEGRGAFLARVKSTAAHVRDHEQDAPLAFFSGRHALFMGRSSWSAAGEGDARRAEHGVLTVLTLADGRVVEHRRWVDYDSLSEADRATPSVVPG